MQIIRTNEVLVNHGLEVTPAREKILRIMMTSPTPLDVQTVVAKIGTRAHQATVYRTLETFVKAGILERVDFQEGKFRYEYMHHHHHHAVCENCGKVEDISDSQTEVSSLEKRLKNKTGFAVTKHILELFGICQNCQKKGLHV